MEKQLLPHQQRVVDEYLELDERREKLGVFISDSPIFTGLPEDEKQDMRLQYWHMCSYASVLESRIKRFGGELHIKSDRLLTFGDALIALKLGKRVSRKGWNGKGLFVVKQNPAVIDGKIIPNMQSLPQSAKDYFVEKGLPIKYLNQMLIIDSQGNANSWVPSSSDCFEEDWFVV